MVAGAGNLSGKRIAVLRNPSKWHTVISSSPARGLLKPSTMRMEKSSDSDHDSSQEVFASKPTPRLPNWQCIASPLSSCTRTVWHPWNEPHYGIFAWQTGCRDQHGTAWRIHGDRNERISFVGSYGLKQATWVCNQKINSFLVKIGPR